MIKFRAWDKFYECMINPAGIELENGEVAHIIEQLPGETTKSSITYYELMQSTGLFDLDGNEIYIGDILKMEDEYTQVVFHEDNTTYGIYLEDKEGGGNPISDYSTRISLNHIKGTIEGNIYEHPHLLEE
ncbi:hypothetical protein BJG89_10555 [Staphylococcus nepalensis]|uniref:YopX family protein n=1 Tax=Staphylococcus nepalensis TaxID=214473 RepID=UPI000BC3569D|nr:YopX family protein [Staphylococcus nepalensis]ATH60689.1 hypothetical protein BJD96_10455 [Staphylococcus nepalensis]ATH65736.1 hypothetical protein BJG89_10555 [Staphylococcus nepalensis]AWI45114.1 hypothetical protein BJG88_10355 [Staphylococcus nepalensis]